MGAIAGLFNIVPGFVWAMICAGLFGWGGVNAYRVNSAHADLAELKSELAELKSEQAQAETDRIREANREISRLVESTNNLNEAYRVQSQTIDDLERRARTDGVRVTKAQRDAAIAQGSTEAVRHYASVAGDVYQACRDEYRALGYDAARGSATAATLKAWVDSYAPAKDFDNKLTTFTDTLKGQ
jgi:chromosome segregation ATPase